MLRRPTTCPRTRAIVLLDGADLTTADVIAVARGRERVEVHPSSRARVSAAAQLVSRLVASDRPIYGVNTGFGSLARVRVDPADARELQLNLLRSDGVGVGPPFETETVRAMMLLRANMLARGHSGVRLQVLEFLVEMLNREVHPVVPSLGSVGASGDLAPLAHIALVLIGEGEAYVEGRRLSGADALAASQLRPIALEPKEGLALINGTQAMTAVACLALHEAETIIETADVIGALSAEALRASDRAWDARLHALRPHSGQRKVAANLRDLLEGSEIARTTRPLGRVQDPYSVRCMPQVHGAIRDAAAYLRATVETELNAVTDNPILFPETDEVLTGGNFHGQPIAMASDAAAAAIVHLANISESRIERLVEGGQSGLPEFLTDRPGLNCGFMVAQYTAAALVAELRAHAGPASIHTIPTCAGMEDHVSMGLHAAQNLRGAVGRAADVLAIEALAAAQGMDLHGERTSRRLAGAHALIRAASPRLEADRVLAPDIAAVHELVSGGHLLDAVGADLAAAVR